MRTWLAEKKSFATVLAKVLGSPRSVPGLPNAYQTDGGRVVWASGHLVQLAEPQDYDPKYAEWKVEHLPIVPEQWRMSEIPDKKRWLDQLRDGMKGATEIIVATDAGREGEYIAWLILHHLGLMRVPKQRLWSSGANEAAIAKSIERLHPYTDKYMLAEAAQIRAESDWIEGLNLTRLLTARFRPSGMSTPISVGRVQTATLAMIVRRMREIADFKPQTYYELEIKVQSGPHTVTLYHRPDDDKRIMDPKDALEICNKVNNRTSPVTVVSEDRSERPPKLFESSSLQIRAYNLWGWPAEKTEDVAQQLYDEKKLITYPRTDGVHLEDEQWNDVPTILGNLVQTPGMGDVVLRDREKFVELSQKVPRSPVKREDVFSSKKLAESGADHHGIIPTTEKADLSELNDDQRKLYALIVRQYLAQFHPDCTYKQKRVSWSSEGYEFATTGRTIINPGWRDLFGTTDDLAEKAEATGPEKADEATTIPPIQNGAMGTGHYPRSQMKHTKAPKVFTEGSIISAMRNILTVVKDPEVKAKLGSATTIGTKSTWGDTVKKLKERYYIYADKGHLKPTGLGEDLIALCEAHAPKLVSIETTAALEAMLTDVENGRMPPEKAREILQRRNINAITQCLAIDNFTLRVPQGNVSRPRNGDKPRPFVDFEGGSYALEVPFDEKDAVKAMGAKFNGETKKWHVPKATTDEADLRARGWLK